MAIYGNTISFGGGGGSNDTLPPLLDNFKATRLEGGLVPPVSNAVAFKDIPDGSKIKLVKGSKISGTVTYGTTTDLNHRIVFDSNDWTRKRFQLENDSSHNNISGSDIDQWLNATKASGWWTNQSTNTTSPDYRDEQGFLYQLGITDELLAQNFNNIQINSESTAKVALPWRVSFSEDIPYTFFKDVTFLDVADYASLYGNSGNDVLVYNKPQTKAPSQITLYNVTAKIHPMMEPKPETKVALDSDGTYFMFEKQTSIVLSADKMPVSRANALAGAVWVYGDHLPKNVNDGTKIELDRNDVVSSELGLSLTLGELPPSDANHKVIVNLPETDGKLHPYLYLTNDYNGSGKGCLLKYIVNETINSTGTKYEDGRFDIACQDFKNRLATSVRGYITPVTIYSWNQSTQGTHISREIFLLSRAEVAEISSNTERFKYFAIQSNRIAKDKGGAARGWWCREFNDTKPSYIDYQGLTSSTSGSQYFRPAVAMSLDLPLNPIPEEDGSYDFLETAKSKLNTIKETKQTVGNLPSKSRVKLGRYGGNELLWLTTKDAEGRQYLRLDSGSVASFPFNSMVFDNKDPNNTDTNIKNYGNNMFLLSNIFQWLNSDKLANNWYTAQYTYDAPPPYANQDGFLKDWTEQEKQILLNKVWEVRVPASVSSSLLKFTAKVVLPSTTEMGLENNTGGSRLDIFNNSSDRIINGSPWWSRNSEKTNTYQVVHPNYNGNIVSSNCNREEIQVVPLVSIPVNTPVELGPDGAYRLLLDVMLPTVKVTVTYPKNKNFYARQFTYNPKKQYQTMLEGATAYLPIMPDGQELSKLPSKSKIKLGKWNNTVLKWIVCKDTSDNQVRLILDGSSYNVLGEKQFDAPEPSNSNSDRRSSGNNRYIWSNLHQWLNSNKPANQWYTSQHGADAPPNYANQNGFLNQWTEKEIKSLELANWTVTKSSVDGSGSETFRSRVTLASTTELGLESGTGGGRLDIMNSNGDRGLGNFYWCRTPHLSFADSVRGVNGVGSLYFDRASYAFGVRPLCKPIQTTLVSAQPDSDGCYTLV